jgi:5-hydroxyisourate hydrolase
MGQLTTHVLDISAGSPAAGMRIEVHELGAGAPVLLASTITGQDGRCAAPLLEGAAFRVCRYAITFHLAEYFRSHAVALPEPALFEEALIRIGIAHAGQHYHVPLLVSPWSYSVYRGG